MSLECIDVTSIDKGGYCIKDSTHATAEKTVAYDEIARQFPGYRNREVIDTLSRGKVHDAGSAQNFFEQAQNVHLMLSGRVDGVTDYRNGVAVAKRSRNMSDGMIVALDSIFNPTTSKTVGRLNIQGRSIAELEATIKGLTTAPTKPAKPAKQKRNWSPEKREALSARMREYHAAKRAAKAAQ